MTLKTLYDHSLSDVIETDKAITKEQATELFIYFNRLPLFKWSDANNNCEARANVICILLDTWHIQNCKAWAFSGYILKKTGYLKNLWKYHVAACIPVSDGKQINYYVIDPATSKNLIRIDEWAANITDNPHSYFLIKTGNIYIFNSRKIKKDNWHKRDRRNFNWTMQGLSGINGVSSTGKAILAFNKRRVKQTKKKFEILKERGYAL